MPVPDAGSLRFRDPWGNNIEVVDYRDAQFTKAPAVLRGMGLDGLEKSDEALGELRAKDLEAEVTAAATAPHTRAS